ncbi:MAG: DUF4369 domain-containing protein [Flavobacteriaceae bacterium]|nr:DUF4369 domain-containing protein [Bacteroidia bacterium]NNK88366.1 DUF4369 domain-containing protein [Flavobacteriaceae bacterium]
MKNLIYLILILLIVSCSTEEPNFVVSGKVRGLQKGTLYLEREQDSGWAVMDSMVINGQPDFVLQGSLEEPEVLMLRLDVANLDSQRLKFFGAPGVISVHTSLKRFYYDAKISGSEQQELLNAYEDMISRFNEKNLELIKKQLETGNDSIQVAALKQEMDNLLKRKYLFAINFAITNKTSQVAPYIALSEIFDANLKYLDTIYKALPDSIAGSKYGKELKGFISSAKKDGLN